MFVDHLNGQVTSDGIYLNPNGMDQGQAMEDLMKRIYFYGEQVKKEYTQGKFNDLLGSETNGEVMHRLIENSMYQRVLHHFTDGLSISKDFFETSSNYNEDSWKVNYTLTGDRNADGSWKGDYFDGEKKNHNTYEGLRKLKDNETTIKNYPIVKNTQYEMANELLKKVIASYKKGSDWNKDKANTVQLVFYSHTKEGQYQELITGRITEPLEIDKYTNDGKTKLEGAKFTFINKYTNERVEWTSKKDNNEKLYLKPGYYIVQEEAPSGYEPIKEFEIQVKRSLVNEDKGPYKFKNLPEIHVNDGYKTEVIIKDKDIPKSAEGTNLVEVDKDNKVKVKLTNIQDNLGDLEFVKKNEFAKLNGAEFTLRKVTANSVDDVKSQIKAQKENPTQKIKYDDAYRQTSKGYYGEFKFEQIPKGYYILEETKVPAGYQKAPLYILEAKEETVAGKNKVVLHFVGDNIPTQKENEKTVIQNKVKETEIKIRKVREENLDTTTEHLGLSNAKFTLTSLRVIDGDFYKKEAYTDKTKPTDSSKPKVDGQQASGGGYISFENLKVGEYILQENEAPKGYAKTKLYGWKLVVKEQEKDDPKTGKKQGDLVYELYEVDKKENINSDKLKKINLDDIKKGDEIVKAFQIGNAPRTIDIPFDKYTSAGGTDEKPVKQNVLLKDNEDNPLEFDLYKADYYGAIISDKPINKHPIVQNKAKQNGNPRKFTDGMYDYSFELHDLEFGGYYVLRERKALKGYRKAGDILLKVEAEAIANEGHMKVIVRNPSVNAHTGAHSIFEGIINYEQGAKLGEFSIKKIGNAIGYEGTVGLRRAYFRLYTADDDYNKKKNPNGYYDYIQKVTPGKPITKDDGKGGQIGVNPDELPPEQGIITFDQLKPGHYVLEEYRGPAGYEKDPGKWYILVDKNGIVTKYRENPAENKNANQVDYSAQSLRYKMSGLDVSDQLPINRLLAPSLEEDLQEIKYDSSTDDLNVTVKASKVDTTNGERTINFSISPKEKQISGEETIIGNNIQLVFVIDRSKDVSELTNKSNPNGPTLDKNINKLITDIVEKAKKSNSNIDVTFIQYDSANNGIVGGVNQDLLALDKSITDTQTYRMTTPSNPNGEDVTIKDYLGKVGIKKRATNNLDGNDRLAKNRDVYYNQITNTTKAYDKRIFIDISNFLSTGAKTFRDRNDGNRKKFQAAEIIWQFRNKDKPVHFDTWMTHVDFYSALNNEYITYMSNNTANDIKGNVQSDHFKFFQNDVENNNGKGLYVNKDFFDKNILTDENFIKERIQNPTDGYLVKDGKLDIGLRPSINLLSTSAKVGTNDISNNIVKDSTNNTISLDGINLKKGESLEFSYTIDLKEGTDFGQSYPINKSDIDKGVKFTNNGKENLIKSTYPKSNGELYTKKIKETPPAPNTYKITINPSENGSVTAGKSTNINKDEEITLTVTPSNGFRLKELKITDDANGSEIQVTNNKFIMPASNVTVDATFEQIPQQGDVDLTTIFTYTNQTHGKDDSKNVPLGNAGRITLQVKQPAQGSNPESWQDLKTLDAPYKGKIDFPVKLDKTKEYRLKYVREENIASVWGSEVTTYININPDNAKNNKLTVTISNGNLTEIFNHDETGFRIPLRITKVNENKAALTGSQFQAKKILNGDRKLYVDILDEKGHKTGKVREAGIADKDPVYHAEKFDGVSEATGEPGDNYFRELTPGIYELTEIKTPDGTYRKPVDDKGNPMKWYFKVFVYKDRQPNGADYMGVDFYFEHTFSKDDDWNEGYQLTDAEKQALIGKTIKGLGAEDSKFNKYIQVIPDDGRSNPARPDAPYKGINDAEVTNYKNKTKLNFFKKEKENHQNLEGAEFSLRKVKMETVEENGKKVQKIVKDKNNKPVIDETESKEEGKRIEPFDEKSQFAKAISDKDLGVNFTDIPEGTYILEEIKPADGYKKIDSFLLIKFTENKDGSWKQEIKGYEKGTDGKYQEIANPEKLFETNENKTELESIYNDKNYIDFKFQKIEGVKGEDGKDIAVDSSDFRVTQVDEDGKPIPGGYDQPLYAYAGSKFTFKNLGVGRYKLQETRALEKFIKPDPWYFNVVQDPKTYKLKIVFEDHDASVRFTPENETDGKNTPQLDKDGNPKDIKIANYQKTRFVFKKQNQDNKALPDVYFNLKKLRQTFDSEAYDYTNDAVSSATYTYNKSARSQKSGSVTFDTLGEGIYELRETDKPEGYDSKAVQDRWIIKVEKTENGLQAIYDKAFEKKYYAKYEKDGYYQDYIKNKFDEKSNLEQKTVGDFSYILTNTKTTTDLKWKKVNQNKETIAKETKFIMLKNSDDPNDLDEAKDGNSSSPPYELIETDGTFEVNNLSKGIYTLIETKAPDGFKQMERQIVIQIYEDEKENYKLKKKFYEMKKVDGENVLVDKTDEFSYIFTRKNNTEVDTDGFGYFYVKNDEKQQYFYLTKEFLTDSNGSKVFNEIKKGELKLKLTNTEDANDVFRTTIDLAKDSNTGIYKFDVNGIKTGKTYLLEEEKAPEGYKLSSNKYKLLFVNDTQNPGKVIAILKAVLDKNNKELKNARGQLVTEDGKVIGDGITINIADPNSILKVINEKNKVEFTKVGKDEVKGEGGKLVTKEDPLKDVEFILQKQDPKDFYKENNGYYPVTKDIEFIKKDDKGLYILRADGRKDYKVGVSNVTIDNSAYKGKSDDKGKFTFEGLTDGFYQIMEPNAPEGYMQVNGPVKKFRVLDGKIYIYDKVDDKFVEKEVTDANIGTLGKIINEKPGKGEFKIKKVDENNQPLANVTYTLHKTDADETPVGEERITDENGEITFKDLPYGYYWLKETKTIDGYILDTKKKLITLGGGDWGETPARKDDVSKYITFDGDQKELISTADTPSKTTVYPNKAEGMIANFKFKIDPNKEIRPGDYFTIDFSDNIDLDGIFKDNDNKGKNPDSQFDIIGPAGKLAEAKINPDRTSITYTFTKYVGDYRPDFISMFMQIFPDRRVVDHTQDITVDVNIGNNTDKTNTDYHYSDSININYRGWNAKDNYDGYQNPTSDISSYMLRLDPDNKTFTAIVYYNPWNQYLKNKNVLFKSEQDIELNSLSVKTYRKSGWGSHNDGYQQGDLPDSYDVDFSASNLTYIGSNYNYDRIGNTGNTRNIYIPNSYLNQNGYNRNTYVIEIKGKLVGDNVQSLKSSVHYTNHYLYNEGWDGNYYYQNTYTGHFETWSEFFNPGAIGDANKELKLLNFKNKIEFVKIDGGVLSNVVDQSSENPESLKDLGIGKVLKGATFKLQKQNGSSWDEVENSTRISDDNGVFSWEGLSEGKYRVIETVTPDDEHYDLPTKEVSSFKVDEKGNIVEIQNNKQIIENYKKAEIRVRKTDENGQTIEGAEFLLEKDNDDKYTGNIGNVEADGTILFNNLPAGKYTLTERKAPKGYTKSDAVWKLEVTRDGKVKWLNSFDDTNDKMKTVEKITYKQNGEKPENLDTEIIGIDKENKTFRQKITIKAKPSDIKKTKLILESTDPSLKLSQANTKVRLVAGDGANQIGNKDNTSYKVEINGGASPNLTLRITPPYKEEDKNKPVGSEQGQTPQEEKEKYYQFIVDMPYKDEGRIGAKATYQIGTINKTSGKVEFGENDTKLVLDKYLEKASQITAGDNKVNMTQYEGKYLARDINLITLDIANIKNPDIYFKKVDADKPDKALAGAVFEIRRKNDSGIFVALKNDGKEFSVHDKEEEKWTSTSDAQGQFEFKEIPDGQYQIVETKAPEGYALVEKIVFKFDVKNGKIYYIDGQQNNNTKIVLKKDKEIENNTAEDRILITNKKAQYPSTGGPGVWIGYTILGLIIMFVAVLTYSKRKDKLIV